MCGIVFAAGDLERAELEKLTERLRHRGPDAGGHFTEAGVSLGHRRLSVLDLSSAANQPFRSRCGRYVVAYNGELYNYRELAARHGLACRTTSDTEVLVEGFARLGPRFLAELEGMFAFAIYDREEGVSYLARDRLGIKPLFYSRSAAASELPALPGLGQRPLDQQALLLYFHLGYIPAPLTVYAGVRKFPAGCWAVLRHGEWELHRYWEPTVADSPLTDEEEALARLRSLLQASVGAHLASDVPFGTFLSGGVDSSLVTALARQAGARPLQTFSISMTGSPHDEAPYARRVARHLGTEHHEFAFTEREALELLPELPGVYAEPYGDSSAAPTMLLARQARQHVTVTLSGDGGDELFLGYGAYVWARRLAHPLVRLLQPLAAPLLALGSERFRRVAELVRPVPAAELRQHIFSQEQYYFARHELPALAPGLAGDTLLPPAEPLGRRLDPAEAQALFDLRYYLPDDLLTKVDRATMRYGMETRVPLLDHRVVELALNLHPRLKLRGRHGKYLLKRLLEEHLPRELVHRRKWGFNIPLARWLRDGQLRELERASLDEGLLRRHGLVDPRVVGRLRQRFHAGETRLYHRLWLVMVLHLWLESRRVALL